MTGGTMDLSTLMNIQNVMENMYDQDQQERTMPDSPIISCYGCEFVCASPLGCGHPNTVAVRWDPIRNKSYRIPSLEICKENNGVCKFFEPDEMRGAGGHAKKKRKAKVTKIDKVLDQMDDDDIPIEEFLENLNDLHEELDEEERGEDKDGGQSG
jgi:hypothetical protein